MNNAAQDYRYYSLPFLLALGFHIIVLAFLMIELNASVQSAAHAAASAASASSQSVIQASAVSSAVLDRYEQQVQAIARQEAQAKAAAAAAAAAKIKQQQLQALQKLQAEQKAAAEKAAVQKAAAEKAAAQKVAAQKTAAQKALQKALAHDMQKELANDQKALSHTHAGAKSSVKDTKALAKNTSASSSSASAASAAQNNGELDKYKALIIQAISSQWIIPPKLPQNISCELSVRLAPGGVVLQVTVTRSSGNLALDNSAVAAVHKASPLPVPADIGLFNQFRELHLTVKPDGSLTEL